MQILIRCLDFSSEYYELRIEDTGLVFAGKDAPFILPYSEVHDFTITQDRHMKTYFTVLCSDRMVEGQILEPSEIEPFMSAIKERLNGIMHIQVRKS